MLLLSQLFGGIGLFLLGVFLMTDGLKTAGGEALRRTLVRFTGRPFSAFLTGTAMTTLVQSSSATTLATIGFVSSGILTFSQSVGLVIGATLGTTTTGWLVSLVGLKFGLGKLAFPLVGIGAMARIVAHGRNAAIALSIAGFGLMFVGLDTLQVGMASLATSFSPDRLPQGTVFARAVLVLGGIVLTILSQSSAAVIAATLASFHSGITNLEQGASVIIGASIGTTFTSALATINATVPAKRTAFAHVLFSAFAGLLAFCILPLFVVGLRNVAGKLGWQPGSVALAGFHSGFTLLSALLVLPGAARFSTMIERLIPERFPSLTRRLDASVAELPEVAIEAIRRTLNEILNDMMPEIRESLRSGKPFSLERGQTWKLALKETRRFLTTVPAFSAKSEALGARISIIHAWDHLVQVTEVLGNSPERLQPDAAARLEEPRRLLIALLDEAQSLFQDAESKARLDLLKLRSQELAEYRRCERKKLMEEAAHVSVHPSAALKVLQGLRWFDAIGYHTWRAAHHLINIDDDHLSATEAFANGEETDPD